MLGCAAGLGLLLPQLAGAPPVRALPPDPEFVHTFEPETCAPVALAGGLVYAAAFSGRAESRGAVPAKLLLARGKPGAAAPPVEVPGESLADSPCALLASGRGAVYLLAVNATRKGEAQRETIGVWDARRSKPQRLAVVREELSFHGLAAALEGEDRLHVVFRVEETWYGTTVSPRKKP